MNVLMVCLGNICRSPMAEGILRHKVSTHHLDWDVDSAGTGSWHIGQPPDHRAQAAMRVHGLDISGLRARQFSKSDFDRFDLILTMDNENYRDVIQLAGFPDHKNKAKPILDYAFPGQHRGVPDPYFNDRFQEVYNLLDASCEELIKSFV